MFRSVRELVIVIVALLVIALFGLWLVGCDLNISQNQTVDTGTGPSPTASPGAQPTPLPSAAPAVATLNVAEFGREGGADCVVAGQPGVLPFRPAEPYCRVLLTCTARDANGTDIGLLLATPAWDNALPTTVNPWNARGECAGPNGAITFSCAVGGKVATRTYECRPVV